MLIALREAWQGNKMQNLRRVSKWRSNFKPFVDQSSWNFKTIQDTLVVVNVLA